MRLRAVLFFAGLLFLAATALSQETFDNPVSMPLAFTENQCQWDKSVLFRAEAGGVVMWFTREGARYQFMRNRPGTDDPHGTDALRSRRGLVKHDRIGSVESLTITASFIGANSSPRVFGVDLMEYRCNYFIGNDPAKWRTNVPSYKTIVFEEIYPGIDLKYYGNGTHLEYDFIIDPGIDLSQIRVQYEGTESLYVNKSGELVIGTKWGDVTELSPKAYQLDGTIRIEIACEYRLISEHTFGFDAPNYDLELALVIDPVLSYGTYLGGGGGDAAYGIAVDGQGCIYVTGETSSLDFPIENEYQTAQGPYDAFVTKLNSSGDSLIFSTYLGGNGFLDDAGLDIALGTDGSIYLTGYTESANFPIKNPYQTYQGSYDAFVTRLGSSGDSLIFSTYLGGSYSDAGYGLAIDEEGNAYVSGETYSTDFPTKNPYQSDQGGWDVFVTKLTPSGDSLIYSTYLGGSAMESECQFDIAVDAQGHAFVTGLTQSTDFPIKNAYQADQGGNDAFVTKLGVSGDSLIYSTYLGGSASDYGYAIAVDDSSQAVVTGYTSSPDFPVKHQYQTYQGDYDVFVTKMSDLGDSLIYSTYIGGSGGDAGFAITLDGDGRAYVTGGTQSSDFPAVNPLQSYQGYGTDAIVAVLSNSGDSLIFGTYLSGNDYDGGNAIAVNHSRDIFVAGNTYSSDFPIESPYQTDQPGQDAFVVRISDVVTDVAHYDRPVLPDNHVLHQNYPNPFNPATAFNYSVSKRCMVTISIYNIIGQKICTIVNEEKPAGTYSTEWDGTGHDGKPVATGVYFYRLEAGDFAESKKMLLIK